MYYSPRESILFCHVSRTGGSTLYNHLKSNIKDFKPVSNQHDPISKAQAMLGNQFDEFYKFAFVRNPWDRLVSWYSLIGTIEHGITAGNESMIEPDSAHWKTFDRFLENWCSEKAIIDGIERPRHSQWHQLTDYEGNLLVDTLGRFENYQEDASKILTKVNIQHSSLLPTNESRHYHYSLYYSDFGRALVEVTFPDDIAQFNYQFRDPE